MKEADNILSSENKAWAVNDYEQYSYYYDKFKQGASLVPRRFNFVEKINKGQLGSSSKAPLVKGITSNQDKAPWNSIEPLEAKIESQFLKPIYTGQSIAPFRVLNRNTAVIPWDNKVGVMNAFEAESRGYTHLGDYLKKIENLWGENSSGKMTFKENINYRNKLENQIPISKLRVVYSASGTNVAAVLLEDSEGIIDTKLYWFDVSNKNEGLYLEGVLNSDFLMSKIEDLQSQGQWGRRDIHRHLLKPPIPKYDSKNKDHVDIVNLTKKIRKIANNVEIDSSKYFTTSRKKIRDEIKNSGNIWEHLNNLVSELLESSSEEEAKIQKRRIQKARQRVPKGEKAKRLKSRRNKS